MKTWCFFFSKIIILIVNAYGATDKVFVIKSFVLDNRYLPFGKSIPTKSFLCNVLGFAVNTYKGDRAMDVEGTSKLIKTETKRARDRNI